MNFEKVINAWQEAATDLQIKIQSPFILATSDGAELKFELLVEQFGGKAGALINSMDNTTDFKTAGKYGYHCSGLNPDAYSVYDRQHFIDTLNDMGYFGEDAQKPNWYTGQPWTL